MKAWAAVAAALLLVCAGCTKKEQAVHGPGRVVVLDTDVMGLSGLTRDEHGALWAPGEVGDAVVRIDSESSAVTRYPVSGLPEGNELEAMAWVDGTRFVLGTETLENGRLQDIILDGRLDGETFKVAAVGQIDYARWRLTAPENRGIEGICSVEGVLVLATELIEDARGGRWAPVGMFDPKTQAWTAHRIRATSSTGKLGAMDCRMVDGTIEAMVVERHYGVAYLLRFKLPAGPEGQWIQPTVAADLSKLVDPLPNFEGLAWLDDGSVVLLTDNRHRTIFNEPSRLYFIPASEIR